MACFSDLFRTLIKEIAVKAIQIVLFLLGIESERFPPPTSQDLAVTGGVTALGALALTVLLVPLLLCQSLVVSTGVYSRTALVSTMAEPVLAAPSRVLLSQEARIVPTYLVTTVAAVPTKEPYTVRTDDNLIVIAKRLEHLCTDYLTIARENKVVNPNLIQAGDVLYIENRCARNTPPVLVKHSVSPEEFASDGGASQEKHFPRATALTETTVSHTLPLSLASASLEAPGLFGESSGQLLKDRPILVAVGQKF